MTFTHLRLACCEHCGAVPLNDAARLRCPACGAIAGDPVQALTSHPPQFRRALWAMTSSGQDALERFPVLWPVAGPRIGVSVNGVIASEDVTPSAPFPRPA